MSKTSPTIFRFSSFQFTPKNIATESIHSIFLRFSTAAVAALEVEAREHQNIEEYTNTGRWADSKTYANLLNKCITTKRLTDGKSIHGHLLKTGFQTNLFLLTTLINMYSKCGSMLDARQVFGEMPDRNVVSWNAMISGYTRHEQWRKALHLFSEMHGANVKPSHFTFGSVLRSCASLPTLEHGIQIHGNILKLGIESDVFVASALVDMYGKCGDVENARQMFDKIIDRDVVSWNAMIAGYAQNGYAEEALKVFSEMQRSCISLNQFALSSILRVCAALPASEEGKQVHTHAIKTGFESEVFVASALVDMYPKCGSMEDALKVFDNMPERDIVSWTSMMVGCAQNGYPAESLKLFCQMQDAGFKPNRFPIASVLSGCAGLGALEQGKQVHAHILKVGFDSDMFVDNALVDMYAKCGSIEEAQQLFDGMSDRDVVSWNAMIAGYAQNEYGDEALKLLHEMQRTNVKPNIFTFGSVLKACASLAALESGQRIHALVIKSVIKPSAVIGCALVDMYAKCGSIENAREVFDTWPKEDVVSWNAMIAAYAQHGRGKEAIQVFEEMQLLGIKPNEISFVSVLFACSHIGLVIKGWYLFDSMSRDHDITPAVDHYICMVDLLGRSGHLDEAEAFVNSLPFEPNALVWKTLLGACRVHCNMEIGKRAAEHILRLDPEDHTTYILLSNMYASSNQWDDVAKVRKMMRERGVRKEAGCSWLEVKNRVHTFIAGDKSHPEADEIYAMLETLTVQMKKAGYVPNMSYVLHDMQLGSITTVRSFPCYQVD